MADSESRPSVLDKALEGPAQDHQTRSLKNIFFQVFDKTSTTRLRHTSFSSYWKVLNLVITTNGLISNAGCEKEM